MIINQRVLKRINWSVFFTLIFAGCILAILVLMDVNSAAQSFDSDQSRIEFRWSSIHAIFAVIMILLSVLLGLGWKRLFPFNVPVALIIAGLWYTLFFLTFTVGWVRAAGFIGLVAAGSAGILLIAGYTIYFVKKKVERSSVVK
ncbi:MULTISPECIES: RND transporter [unclassified Sporosarcina]|uniref:RND transporter n=1 Tax=unclassified Sporosarcina TaxID=2647733 RepID=UPI00203EBFE1|nr:MULTISPECIES: RND transporter [unclassified Sporosarcina]GKV67136.1 hypothetical protein NCCP2331_32890 [Sporosarcina sp. NCCP-2331]GLB57466.1 hypothetical protein NCCP2378_32540 [Sporosarcina sp. NCCP-2378]